MVEEGWELIGKKKNLELWLIKLYNFMKSSWLTKLELDEWNDIFKKNLNFSYKILLKLT